MIDGGGVLALIPARGGSKGLPGKNVRPLGGRPLIAWTVAAARASALVDRVILSSDDPEIIAAAEAAGCEAPFVRPAALATDEASTMAVIRHAVDRVEATGGRYAYLVLLQPTSPLRTAADIDACVRLCHDSGADTAVTVVESGKSPYWMYHRDDAGRLQPVLPPRPDAFRRQNLAPVYVPNGAVYVARWEALRRIDGFIAPGTPSLAMPPERSIDIDSALDMIVAEAVLSL